MGEKYTRIGKKVYLRHLNAFSERLLSKAENLGVHFSRGRTDSDDLAANEDQAMVKAAGQNQDTMQRDSDDETNVELVGTQTPLEALSDSNRTPSGALVRVTVDEVVGHRPAVVRGDLTV